MPRVALSSPFPLLVGLLLGLGAIVSLLGVTRASTAAELSEVAAVSPEAAVAAFVQSGGGAYAGDCATTRAPEDIGTLCSRRMGARDHMTAYLVGRTFSEFSTWVFVQGDSAGWSVAGSAPLDFHDLSMTIPWP